MKINHAVLALIVANLIWGAASPIFKYSLQNIPPFSLAFLRFLLACLVMYPLVHKQLAWSDLKDRTIWVLGLLGISINIGFFFLALQKTNSINAPIISSIAPIIILIGSMVFLKERAKSKVIFGIILSFLGVLTIILQPMLQTSLDGSVTGNVMLVLATLGGVGHTLISRKYLTTKNVIPYTFWQFFVGMLSFMPFAFQEFTNQPTWMAALDTRGYIGILFGGLLSSAVAYYLYNLALARLPAFQVSVFGYMDPVVAILIAVPLLGEKVTPVFIGGSILVFAGIFITEGRLHWHPFHKLLERR